VIDDKTTYRSSLEVLLGGKGYDIMTPVCLRNIGDIMLYSLTHMSCRHTACMLDDVTTTQHFVMLNSVRLLQSPVVSMSVLHN